MNPLKHMELIFGMVAVAALLTATLADRDARAAALVSPAAQAGNPAARPVTTAGGAMAVVIITGKRLSSRDKRRAALADSHMRIF